VLPGLGADDCIDYGNVQPEEVVGDVDLVVDAVGGPATARFLPTLKPGGALYPIFPLGFDGSDEAKRRGVTVSTTQVRSNGAQLAEIVPLLDSGLIRVGVDSIFTLAEARKAHERAAAGHIRSKIALTVARGQLA